MQVQIEGKNIDLTDAIKDYAEAKVQRICNHFDSLIQNHEIRVVLSVLKNRRTSHKAEITIFLKGGHVIRSEDSEDSIYASLDLVADKIEGQLRKYKTRIYSRIKHGKSVKDYGLTEEDLAAIPAGTTEQVAHNGDSNGTAVKEIIKTKRFKMEPLDPEVAVEKLHDTGHEFYMFLNVFTNRIACVYKREDGDYGLIEPEFLEVAN